MKIRHRKSAVLTSVVVGSAKPPLLASVRSKIAAHKRLSLIIVVALVLVAGGATFYLVRRHKKNQTPPKKPPTVAQQQRIETNQLARDGKTEEAKQSADKAIESAQSDPAKYDAYSDKAATCMSVHDYACAATAYEQALKLQPNRVLAKRQLAKAYLLANQKDKAIPLINDLQKVVDQTTDADTKQTLQADLTALKKQAGL